MLKGKYDIKIEFDHLIACKLFILDWSGRGVSGLIWDTCPGYSTYIHTKQETGDRVIKAKLFHFILFETGIILLKYGHRTRKMIWEIFIISLFSTPCLLTHSHLSHHKLLRYASNSFSFIVFSTPCLLLIPI